MPQPIAILLVTLALCAGLAGAPARAQGVLEGCADPQLEPSTTLSLCRKALQNPRLSPENRASVLVNLGVAQAALGRHADAVRSYSLAIATRPGLVVAHANRARSHRALGERRAAMRDYAEVIALAPEDPEGWMGRGTLRLGLGDAAGAESDLTEAVRLAPEPTDALFNRGIARLALGRDRAAAEDFTTVIARSPEDPGAHLNRGRARAAFAPERAEADLDRAIALAPDWGAAHAARGRFLERRGRMEAANADYLRAYELGFSEPWLLERVRRLSGE
jgi:tetratricopeptide (TPR) repeat protein